MGRVGVMVIFNEFDNIVGAGGIAEGMESFCCNAPVIINVNIEIGFVSARCKRCNSQLGVCTKEDLLADFKIDITKMGWYPREKPKF